MSLGPGCHETGRTRKTRLGNTAFPGILNVAQQFFKNRNYKFV